MTESNCKKCSLADTERMVQCDTCDKWFHFECVDVNSNIAEISWNCDSCGHQQAAAVKSTTDQAPHGNKTPSFPENSAASQQLENISRIMSETEKQTNPTTVAPIVNNGFNISNVSTIGQDSRTLWSNLHPQARSSSYVMGGYSLPNNASQVTTNDILAKQRELKLRMLEEEKEIQKQYLEKKYQILSQSADESKSYDNFSFNTSAPTSSQLAARQVIPKDLPSFDGNPEDWPLFLSSFRNSTEIAGYSDAENLMRLQSCLRGKAKDLVKNKLLLPSMVSEIIQTLEMCYGRPEYILESLIEKTRKFPPPKEKLENLIDYAIMIRNLCSTMEACSMTEHLNNPMLVKELVEKLPNTQKLNWAMHPKDTKTPIIKSFSDWIYNLAIAASQVVSPVTSKRNASIHTHTKDNSNIQNVTIKTMCTFCDSNSHKIQNCERFKNAPLDRKWHTVNEKKLCRTCLNGHRRKCFVNKVCGIDNCTAKHHQLMHKYANNSQVIEQPISNDTNTSSNKVNVHEGTKGDLKPLFRFLPVRLHSKSKVVDTFAFLDEGSSVTLMEEDLLESLNLRGEKEPLTLRWTGETTREEEESVKTSLVISDIENKNEYLLKDVHTVKYLGLPTQSLNVNELVNKNPFLNGIPIKSYSNAKPKILIGVNNWKLAIPLKVREGSWNQPIASKTRLGWTVQGSTSQRATMASLNIHSKCECGKLYQELHEQIKSYWSIEVSPPKELLSAYDLKTLKTLENTCQKVDGRYEVSLLWKNDNPQLPDSYNYAMHRLNCLKKKFVKDKNLEVTMRNEIDKLVAKGYAKRLFDDEINSYLSPTWYLPIFIARNPNKPEKVRLVWDAAAKVDGTSLNDFLMTGPDMLRPLFDILIEFRVGAIGICGDISEMFHRINVREKDMHVQRFLWLNDDEKQNKPSVYVMRALTFGMCCAPCIAHFVRNKNAETFATKYPQAVKAIQFHHYMDDFIDSVDTEEEALELATNVRTIHAAAGFNMHNWLSNSITLQKHLSGNQAEEPATHNMGSIEKILGMYWDPTCDVFRYICRFKRVRRDVMGVDVTPTKREVLQVLMSIFDPLGFLSIFTIGLKILLQDIWRTQIQWDEELTKDLRDKWQRWTLTLSEISEVTIPRCYSLLLNIAGSIELHTFVDAAEYAYAAVCYIRVQYNSEVNLSIIAAKCKVAPLKPMSIPRMELQAAVAGVRLATKIIEASRIKFGQCYWWTDSKTVLNWLAMDPRKFKPFVMLRIGEILEATDVSQWRWVPSKSNPADAATKISKPNSSQWFGGPDFLKCEKDQWPSCVISPYNDNRELRHTVFHIRQETPINYKYFSNWRNLYRALGTFIFYIERLKRKINNGTLPKEVTFEMLQKSKDILYRHAQHSRFQEEISDLHRKAHVSKNSPLRQLNPYIDDNGILRAEGRIESLNHNRPVILPNNHHISFLIVRYYHEEYHHCFHETIISHIRSKFYIPRIRVLYKTVRKECQHCRNKLSAPLIPQMAPLPKARLACFERPFTFVGIDFFGPYLVIVGRHKEKRWGVIFTCLTLRAVHIEIAHSLDTSSCVMCIANFIHRRGMPREIFTDNGTNFKATAKTFKEEQQRLNLYQLTNKFDEIKWKFNPPAAPHMGGAWERMVKSVKTVLEVTCPNFKFNDESFRSALSEAEFIINSRPLTFVSLDADDDEPLTPNHLLLGSSSGYKPYCSDSSLRDRWRQTQKFADYFWKRWVKEYSPNLLRRGKWYNKQEPASVGDIVVLVDENLPRNTWPKGVIIETTTAKDGQVRRVKIKTANRILERPVSKVAILDVGTKTKGKVIST